MDLLCGSSSASESGEDRESGVGIEEDAVDQTPETVCLFATGKKRLFVQSVEYDDSDCVAEREDSDSIRMDDIADFAPLQVLCEVNGYTVPAIIDTGAQISIMSYGCAQRCRISGNIDTKYSGRAIGVGSSDILGRINGLSMRVGPISFDGKVSILRDSRVDFLIGLDFLKRFNCEVSFKDNALKLQVNNKMYKIPLMNDCYRESEHLRVPHSKLGDENYDDDYLRYDEDPSMRGYSDHSDSNYHHSDDYSDPLSTNQHHVDGRSEKSCRSLGGDSGSGSGSGSGEEPSVADIIASVKLEAEERAKKKNKRHSREWEQARDSTVADNSDHMEAASAGAGTHAAGEDDSFDLSGV